MRTLGSIPVLVLLASCAAPAPRVQPAAPAPPPKAEPEVKPEPAAEPVDSAITAALNLDFEVEKQGHPAHWYVGGDGYEVGLDGAAPHTGAHSLRLKAVDPKGFGVATNALAPDSVRGKRVRLRGYLRTEDITTGYAGLWMRLDAAGQKIVGFDNMGGRGVTGTTDWAPYEIVLNVPEETQNIVFGALLTGDGTAWVDSLSLELLPPVERTPVEVAGTVVDGHGAPVAGALVALVADAIEPPATAVSNPAGRFRLTVPAGRYAITATASGLTGAYLAPRRYEPGLVPDDLKVTVGGAGLTHVGSLKDDMGEPIAGELVALARIGNHSGDVWYTRTAADGSFAVTVPAADKYLAQALVEDGYGEATPVPGRAAQSGVELVVTRLSPAPDRVVSWIGQHAIPLRTVVAGSGFEDMKPLRALVGDAHVVALGEATHGTREFFQMKHRMLEFLVEKMGFTVFAIEANLPEARAVDDYVMRGVGDPRKALAGLYFWTWNTEEVLDQIEWMRRYNADPEHRRKVRFYGFDMQFGAVAAAKLQAYLEKIDPSYAATVAELLRAMQDESYTKTHAAAIAAELPGIEQRLDDRRKAYVKRAGRRAWQLARQDARVLVQATDSSSATGLERFEARDRAMADNIDWIRSVEPAGARMVVWAHNGHVAKHGYMGIRSMGTFLNEKLGDDYRVFGFAFGQGGFQAFHEGALEGLEVGPPPSDSVGATFVRAGCSICVLGLEKLPAGSPAATWLASPRRMRSIGAVYTTEANMIAPKDLPGSFDALIFVARTSRARPVTPPKPAAAGE